jgi:RimJ/RimL family protein N-acetyltransferase
MTDAEGTAPAAIETDRLHLVPTRGEHAGALWHAIEGSLPELTRWMSWASSSSPRSVSEYAIGCEKTWREGTGWDWVIFLGDEVAGTIGLNRYDELWRSSNLGYWVRSDLAGQGIATEAGRAVVRFAFEEVALNRLELVADVDNLASQRVAEKLGFRFEGTKREGAFVGGRGVDTHLFGLIASDPR